MSGCLMKDIHIQIHLPMAVPSVVCPNCSENMNGRNRQIRTGWSRYPHTANLDVYSTGSLAPIEQPAYIGMRLVRTPVGD